MDDIVGVGWGFSIFGSSFRSSRDKGTVDDGLMAFGVAQQASVASASNNKDTISLGVDEARETG